MLSKVLRDFIPRFIGLYFYYIHTLSFSVGLCLCLSLFLYTHTYTHTHTHTHTRYYLVLISFQMIWFQSIKCHVSTSVLSVPRGELLPCVHGFQRSLPADGFPGKRAGSSVGSVTLGTFNSSALWESHLWCCTSLSSQAWLVILLLMEFSLRGECESSNLTLRAGAPPESASEP
jgi:hypothetical protein